MELVIRKIKKQKIEDIESYQITKIFLETKDEIYLMQLFYEVSKEVNNIWKTKSSEQSNHIQPSVQVNNHASSNSNPVQTNTQSQNIHFYGLSPWLIWSAISSVTILSGFKILFIIMVLIYKKCEWELIGLTKESCEFIANLL